MQTEPVITTKASPAKVWTLVEDPEHLKNWFTPIKSTVATNGATTRQVGTTFRQVIVVLGKPRNVDGEIVEYQPERKLSVKISDDSFTGSLAYVLTPTADGGTEVRMPVEIIPRNMLVRAAVAVSAPLMGGAAQTILNQLKNMADNQA